MGTVLGAVLGDAFLAPFKALFGNSCEEVCVGTWDVTCFIEHLCISSLIKLVMVLGLCYITFLFFYLLFKVGIIQCVIRSLCKMFWSSCEAYWSALEGICCFMWYKLKNTERVYRGHHRRDLEEGYSSNSEDEDDNNVISLRRKRLRTESRKDHHMNRSLHMVRWRQESKRSSGSGGSGSHRHHVKLRTGDISVHLKSSHHNRRKDQMKKRSFGKRMDFKRKRMW